jgi:hypothetical protein
MVDLAQADVVAILTRAPSAGGKSRLFSALGIDPDPSLLQALLLDTVDGVDAPGVRRVVAVDPPDAAAEIRRIVAPDVGVIAQGDGSLGDRMRKAFADLLGRGARTVVLVGSDLPEIEPRIIRGAVEALARNPAHLVIGPAGDGGYYLIAANHPPDVFDGMAWGTADVLAATLAAADRGGRAVHLLPRLSDVDAPEDLRRVARGTGARGWRTAAWVRQRGLVAVKPGPAEDAAGR